MENMSVLIIDDEPDFLEMTKMALEMEGHKIITATSGKEAIDLIKKNKPDMVFLDIKMPDMDGIETLRRIREFDNKTPVIMVTAYGTIKNWQESIELKIHGYVPKGSPGDDTSKLMLKILKLYKKPRT